MSPTLMARLGGTHELRSSFLELDRWRCEVIVPRIAVVSAQIRTSTLRAAGLRDSEAGRALAERLLEDRQECVNRLIIQTQQVANGIHTRCSSAPSVDHGRHLSLGSSSDSLDYLSAQLKEEADNIRALVLQIQETAQQWPLADLSADEIETWQGIARIFDDALRLVDLVIRFAADAVQHNERHQVWIQGRGETAAAYDDWRQLWSCMGAWRAIAQHTETTAENLMHMMHRQTRKFQRRLLQTWRREVQQKTSLDEVELRLRLNRRQALGAIVLCAWLERARQGREYREMKDSATRLQQRATLRRYLGGWKHESVSHAGLTLHETAFFKTRQASEALIAMHRASSCALLRLFRAWSERCFTLQRVSKRLRSTHITRGCIRRVMADMLAAWHQQCAEQRRLERTRAKVVARLKNRVLALAFSAWDAKARQQRRAAAAGARVVMRWRLRCAGAAFETWRSSRVEKKQLARAASKVVRRWAMLAVAVPFEAWNSNVERQQRMRLAGTRIVRRLLRRAVSLWRRHGCHQRGVHVAFSKMVRRTAHGMTAAAFDSWSSRAIQQVSGAPLPARLMLAKAAPTASLPRHSASAHDLSCLRLSDGYGCAAFADSGWLMSLSEQRDFCAGIACRAGLSLARRTVCVAFVSWRSWAQEQRMSLGVREDIVIRLERASILSVARLTWSMFECWQQHAHRAHTMRRILLQARAARLEAAFFGWKESCREERMTQVISALLSWLEVRERQVAPVQGRYLRCKPEHGSEGRVMSAIDPTELFQYKWQAMHKHASATVTATALVRAAAEEQVAGPKLLHPAPVARFLPKSSSP